jgi:thioredoxin 1
MASFDDAIAINDSNFKEHVLDASGTVAVLFAEDDSLVSREVERLLESIAYRNEGKLKVCKLEIADYPDIKRNYGVMEAPTVIVFIDGKKKGQIRGYAERKALTKLVGL